VHDAMVYEFLWTCLNGSEPGNSAG
jgi:hypothetical protein